MASNLQNAQPPNLRLLLDQGFPLPPGFDPTSVDRTVSVEHLSRFDPRLSQASTPDWVVYCRAAEGGFDALVTRDRAQLDEPTEMYVLSRLPSLAVITWRQRIEDPIREWGQLLAYLPEVKRLLIQNRGGTILLPAPKLSSENVERASHRLGRQASSRRVSQQQVRAEARQEIRDWSETHYGDGERFDPLLGHRSR